MCRIHIISVMAKYIKVQYSTYAERGDVMYSSIENCLFFIVSNQSDFAFFREIREILHSTCVVLMRVYKLFHQESYDLLFPSEPLPIPFEPFIMDSKHNLELCKADACRQPFSPLAARRCKTIDRIEFFERSHITALFRTLGNLFPSVRKDFFINSYPSFAAA